MGLCYTHVKHLHRLSFTILLSAFLLTDNTVYIRFSRHSHIGCLTSVIYTGQVGCSRGRPLFRSYGPVGYLCGGLRPPPLLGSFFTPTLPTLHFVLYMVRYGIDLEFLRSRIWSRDSNSNMPAGFFSGALIPLLVCTEKEVIGIWLSMAQSVSSLANLSGPPIAGSCFSSASGEVTVI